METQTRDLNLIGLTNQEFEDLALDMANDRSWCGKDLYQNIDFEKVRNRLYDQCVYMENQRLIALQENIL